MQYITDGKDLQLHNTAIALGKFDGFHRGHQLLFHQVQEWQQQGRTGVIFTFGQPKAEESLTAGQLTSTEEKQVAPASRKFIDSHVEKLRKAEQTGIDVLLEYPFTKEFASQTPEEFVQSVLIQQLDVKEVAVGEDFRFGRHRSGDAALLQQLGLQYGFQVVVLEKLRYQGQEIGSSAIREAIAQGDMAYACQTLGRGYSIYGEIIHGAALGRTIGIPTINQTVSDEKILPPYGVYAARCHVKNQILYGVANLGCKPTVGKHNRVGLETHLFDFHQDIYGEMADVELLEYIRPEKKFSSVEALVEQMKCDIKYVKHTC